MASVPAKAVDLAALEDAELEPSKALPPPAFPGWPAFSALRRILFLDVDPLVRHGYRTRLEQQDMYQEPSVATKHLIDLFQPELERQKERQAVQLAKDREALAALDAELTAAGVTLPPAKPPFPPAPAGPPGAKPAPKPAEPSPKLTSAQRKRVALATRVERSTRIVDLRRVVLAGNIPILLFTGGLYVISQACSLAGPLLLQRIVKGLQCNGPSCEPKNNLYYYCLGLFLAPLVQSLCENQQQYLLYLAGTRMRNALMATIYRKCLALSNSSMQEESTGRVVTLMSNDAQKLQDATFAIHQLWGAPIYIIVVVVLLWFQVGWATFVGLAVMLLLGPASGKLAAKLGMLRREILRWTDRRVSYMNELISGIQMIKFYAWEQPFTDKVQGARAEEAKRLRTTAAWQGVFGMILFSGPVLVAICCFGAWTLAGNDLGVANAYAALAYFSLLRFPMSFLPMMITMVVNALVALRRIGAFLNKSESALSKEVLDLSHPAGHVEVKGGEFTWDAAATKSTISGINFKAGPGSLTMIVGGVGSGKSSVLGALVGHMNKVAGHIKVGGRVAYVAQTAWIMNDTLQENVILGDDPMKPDRYQMALKVSQLGPDLDMLPNGDMTEIGDRGVTLSGGQKQRVSIARAVYSDADVYILDDPLSAVDSHVGRALFDECIRGALASKTVILVTNALQYLPQATNVLWIEKGRVRAQGPYVDLVSQGLNIAELQMEEEEDSEEDSDEQEANVKGKPGKPNGQHVASPIKGKEGKRHSHEHKRRSHEHKKVGAAPGSKSVTLSRAATGANRNLTGIEERETGSVSWDVVKQYVRGGGGGPVLATVVLLIAIEQGTRVYTDRWVGIWSGDVYNESLGFYLGIYAMLGVVYGFITFVRSLRFMFMTVDAAVTMHHRLLGHLLRLPKVFFDINPSGRILNRFSRDMDIMDSTLPASLSQFINCVAMYLSILVVISIATKWFAIALIPLTIIYFFVQRYYIPTAREVQRLESVSRSPIYSKFGEALLGVATIRAYRKEAHFTQVSDELMEENAYAFMTLKLASSWLAMRLDFLGLFILTGCGVLLIAGNVNPGLAGLALTYALDLTRYLKHGTNMASKSESDFNSVERIVQYLRPDVEPEPDTRPEVLRKMPDTWPTLGAIEVSELTLRYRPELPLVLLGVSFRVEGGEKVGLVGRTGSGKSSILLALFRMVEPTSGTVYIDGVDTHTLGVRHLRSKMSIIPQDPFMFSGTVRHNLDPFEEYTDARLWEVLEAVNLKGVIDGLESKLGAKVVDNGANFSLGQRQLFCLARAMLRNSRILMLDEATASIDPDTDAQLQGAIRTAFSNCTMLTIAHRLNTIMDSDKVVVLDAGRVVEVGDAHTLLQADESLFTRMVGQTGKRTARYLKSLASMASLTRQGKGTALPSMTRGQAFGTGARSLGTALRTDPKVLGTLPYETALDARSSDGEGSGSGSRSMSGSTPGSDERQLKRGGIVPPPPGITRVVQRASSMGSDEFITAMSDGKDTGDAPTQPRPSPSPPPSAVGQAAPAAREEEDNPNGDSVTLPIPPSAR